ncbi:UMP kinase [Candidatus Roizmanbacteria bacterium CG_4_8_14_3_um_filter_36_10]|uniref:UMP kinase n=1 Tax=Candidatus Roizmanbacteria bacterium CG_4_8_14_3_um_filter_36_10 TaxID=1974834 RepID=A0A2M8GLZ1_9BACT|nr:MAG: UMP kinase [Candidatus Roizmanbacteria bacterium CG_4_8_14_3_um_filter_36_10]
MFYPAKEAPIIISVGGSLIVPNGGIDNKFLSRLNFFIRGEVKRGRCFFLVTGGGRIARHYRDAGKAVIGNVTDEDLDWIAIHATRLNAHLLRTIFEDIAHPRIVENYDKKLKNWKEPVVIGAGWKPGWSTDYDAVKLAIDYRGKVIINLSNIDWVYDKDPNKYKDAKPIKKMVWEQMEKLVKPNTGKWIPGLSAPFDPIASQLAKKHQLTVIITNGQDFKNLERIIDGDCFKGTIIMPCNIDAGFYDHEYYRGRKGDYRVSFVESFFGRIFHNLINFYRAFLIKIFINPKNCLDVGCGIGQLVRWLRFFGIDSFGIEISKDALELADKKTKPFLKQGDITDIPYKDNQFDLVFTYDVMEHLERSKIKKAAGETIRVSRKYIFHKIYTQENFWITLTHGKDFSHLSVFTKRYWQSLFGSFENISILRSSYFRLPLFFETIFLLKKK